MFTQSGGEGLGGRVREHVHDAAGLDVNEDGPVGAAPAERELVDAQNPRRPFWHFGRFQQPRRRVRPAAMLSLWHSRSPARPPSSVATARSHCLSPTLERTWRSLSPGTCSTKVVRRHLARSRKKRRTRRRIANFLPASGRSASVRQWEKCLRLPRLPQPGQRAACGNPHQHDLWTSSQPFQFDIDSGEQNIFDRAESHAHVIPQGNDLACMPLTWDFTELRSESKFEIGISGHGGLYGALAQGRVDADRVH